MSHRARLVIIGAGTAGLTALKEAQRHTDEVLLINAGPHGTTCARVGCMPSKALLAPAHAFQARAFFDEAGIRGTEVLSVDLPAVLARVRRLRDRFVQGPLRLAGELGERSLSGRPRFLDAHTLEIDGRRIQTDATLIATGTRPVVPERWRSLGDRVLTTDELFEQTDLGQRVAVVGLGAVGTELGQGLADLGLDLHAFTRSGLVAGLSDPRVNEVMVACLRRDMIVHAGDHVVLEDAGAAVRVSAGEHSVEVDWVLAALGRRPNLEGLGLETLGLDLDAEGMPPFDPETLRVGDLPIWIAGDVNGERALMHEAADEGRIAAYHALHPDAPCLGRRAPLAIVFSRPNVAVVGTRHADLEAGRFVEGEADFSEQPRALMAGENAGLLRLYADARDGRLLGAEMAVPEGEHLAHLLAWSLQQRLDLDALLQMPFYHPVVEEGLRGALQQARRALAERRRLPDLPLCHEAADWALGGG